MTLVEGKYFRVKNITRLECDIDENKGSLTVYSNELDLEEGLAIEKKIKDYKGKEGYIVIAFIKPNFLENSSYKEIIFEDISFRSIEELDHTNLLMMEEYKNCVEFAKQALEDIICR